MKRKPPAVSIVLAGFLFLSLPAAVSAVLPIARFVFITEPQTIVPGGTSGEMRIQAQDADGSPTSAGKTLCLGLFSTSGTGEFSSNPDNWNSVKVLTINSNWTSRVFYYKDSGIGNHRIDARIAVKAEGTTCPSWPVDEWSVAWSISQNIIVGAGGASLEGEKSLPAASTTANSVSVSPRAAVSPRPLVPTIEAFAGDDRVVPAGVETEFVGNAIGLTREPIANARFWWNFGDGETREGKTVGHVFRALGMYTVGLHVSSGEYAASDYLSVSVIPNKITILAVVTGKEGFVRLQNGAPVAVDIGGWMLEDDARKRFYLPVRTMIAPTAQAAFANRITALAPDKRVFFRDPDGSLAASWDASMSQQAKGEKESGGPAVMPVSLAKSVTVAQPEKQSVSLVAPREAVAASSSTAAIAQSSAVPDTARRISFPGGFFAAAFLLSGIAAAGFFFVRRMIP